MGDYLGSVALPSMKERQRKLCQIKLKPRAEPVYNDSNNIGVRMLEKLGWSEGKGLGKREDGMSTPILPKTKQDSEGFGYAGEKDNHWAQHDQDFNQLLKSLNGGEDGAVEDELDMAKIKSLEEKSKNSRARVHYKKFTRGKDLSRASEKDLANIFGKRTLEDVKNPAVVTEMKEQESVEEVDGEPQETNILGLTTIKATMSVQDYFKNKMQEKLGVVKCNPPADVVTEETPLKKKSKKALKNRDHEEQLITDPVSDVLQVEINADEVPKMKKKKKRSKDEEILETVEENTIVNDIVEEGASPVEEPPKKKSKKEKRKNLISEIEGNVNGSDAISNEVIVDKASQLDEVPKKKSKKEKRKHSNVEHELECEVVNADVANKVLEEYVTPTEESPRKKIKKENRKTSIVENEAAHNLEQEQHSIVEESVDKKPKKKKSKKSSSDEPEEIFAPAEEVETPSHTESITKKKKKKSKDEPVMQASKEVSQMEGTGGDDGDDEITCRVKVSVLKQLDERGFPGANFADIVGYGLTQDVKLVKREGNRKPSLEKHRFIQQKQTSFQRRRQMLKKVHSRFIQKDCIGSQKKSEQSEYKSTPNKVAPLISQSSSHPSCSAL